MSLEKGVLLVNLGTPSALSKKAVGTYLREFLMDPHVIDISAVARWFLVNCIIVPTRTKKSLEAYSKIWQTTGSPLLIESLALHNKVEAALGTNTKTLLAMRYGRPSIEDALIQFAQLGIKSVKAILLYPQFASSSTGTAIEEVKRVKAERNLSFEISYIHSFYKNPSFIKSWASVFSKNYTANEFDHFVMSFHGLPERHLKKLERGGAYCLSKNDCCERWAVEGQKTSPFCYRAQCFATANAIAEELKIHKKDYTVTFQSRLGKTPWIQPFTDLVIPELPKKGFKKVAVFCPSFVADCLETLEEIKIRANESFLEAGGERLALVPSLNSDPEWVQTVVDLANQS